MLDRCPGSANIRTPTLTIKKCPECGEEVEVFSSDTKVVCSGCGFTIYNDISGCVRWCRHAKDCLGQEVYDKLSKG